MNGTAGGRVLKIVAVTAIVAWSIGPIVLGVLTSISTQRDVTAVPSHWLPTHVTSTAYRELLQGSSSNQRAGVSQGLRTRSFETPADHSLLVPEHTVGELLYRPQGCAPSSAPENPPAFGSGPR